MDSWASFYYNGSVEATEFKSPLPPRRVDIAQPDPASSSSPPAAPSAPPAAVVSSPAAPKIRQTPSFLKYLLIVLGILLLLFIVFKFLLPALSSKNKEPVTLNYWGLWENPDILQGVIAEFEAKNPGIKVKYRFSDKSNYRSRLAGRLEKDPTREEIPDIFRIHSSWLPMFSRQIAPVPAATAANIGLDKDYYQVYQRDLRLGNSYYAIPLMYDGLVLFYNKSLLQSAGSQLPQTWWDLQALAKQLTVRDDKGKIMVAGAAMGLTGNVDHWSDIVGLILRQNGASLTDLNDPENDKKITAALNFYTTYYSDRVWDETLPNSTQLFAQNKLVFYLAPSWRYFELKTLNPQLSFGIIPAPQIPILKDGTSSSQTTMTNIHWGSYWVEAVNLKSPHQKEAWQFLEFLSQKETLEKLYQTASLTREFGEIYPRISLATKITSSFPELKAFTDTAPEAQSGPLSSFTHDEGLNDETIKYVNDALNAIITNPGSTEYLSTLKNGLTQLAQKYNLK